MVDAFAGTLHLAVRESGWHRRFTILIYGAALVVGAILAFHRPWFMLALPPIVAAAMRAWRRARLHTGRSIWRLRWQADGRWRWQTADGRWHEGERRDDFVFATCLVVITLRERNQRWRRRHCVLFNDSLDADTHRQLRARLTVAPRPPRHSADA